MRRAGALGLTPAQRAAHSNLGPLVQGADRVARGTTRNDADRRRARHVNVAHGLDRDGEERLEDGAHERAHDGVPVLLVQSGEVGLEDAGPDRRVGAQRVGLGPGRLDLVGEGVGGREEGEELVLDEGRLDELQGGWRRLEEGGSARYEESEGCCEG